MKIVQLIDSLSPGGAERFVVDLSNQLAETDEVYVFTFRNRGERTDFYRSQLSGKVKQIAYYGGMGKFGKIWQLFVIFWKLLCIRPDIVHTHMVSFSYAILPYFLIPRLKVFYTVHNVAEKDTEIGFVAKLRKKLLKNTFCGITISPYCEKTFAAFYGYHSFKMIENGCREIHTTEKLNDARLEVESFKHSKETKVFVCVARIMTQKNHQLMVKCFDDLCSEGKDIELLLIGGYQDGSEIKQTLDNMITCDRIHFLGTRENVTDYLAVCDFFCLSSLWEGLPISLLEAGMSGCYPVCTPVGGIPDVISSEEMGILSDDVTVESFYNAIQRAMLKQIDRNLLVSRYNERYSMKTCASRYLEQYGRALNK